MDHTFSPHIYIYIYYYQIHIQTFQSSMFQEQTLYVLNSDKLPLETNTAHHHHVYVCVFFFFKLFSLREVGHC